ncbi:MAG TPA: ribonuclease P protein component [Thermodesulfobacteriota bacterium]
MSVRDGGRPPGNRRRRPRGAAAPLGFPKSARLRTRADYDRASRGATSITTPHFKLVRGRGPGGGARLGLIVPRKIGGAVVRNRVKRRLREWFRALRPELPEGLDLIVIARPGAERLSGRALAAELTGALSRGDGNRRARRSRT